MNTDDNMVTVTIKMPKTLHDELKAFSHAHDMSVTEMMRQATGVFMAAEGKIQ